MKHPWIGPALALVLAEVYALLVIMPTFSFMVDAHYLAHEASRYWMFLEMPFLVITKYLTVFVVASIALASIAPLPKSNRTPLVFLELYAFEFVVSALALVAVWSAKTQFVSLLYFLPLVQHVAQSIYAGRRLKTEEGAFPLMASVLFLSLIVADRVHYSIYDYYAKLF